MCGFKGFTLLPWVLFYGKVQCVHYAHKALLDATVHIITLPKVLRATLYGGVAILLSPVPPQFPSSPKLHVCCSIPLYISQRSTLILI